MLAAGLFSGFYLPALFGFGLVGDKAGAGLPSTLTAKARATTNECEEQFFRAANGRLVAQLVNNTSRGLPA